jgi:hypothetical protein
MSDPHPAGVLIVVGVRPGSKGQQTEGVSQRNSKLKKTDAKKGQAPLQSVGSSSTWSLIASCCCHGSSIEVEREKSQSG